MSVHAGTIVHVGGNNVIDRIQSAGLGDVRVPTELIREVGNEQIVDKVITEPDFTFTLESLDVSTEIEAFLLGVASGGASFDMAQCGFVNICSPWKDHATASAGTVVAGHLVPGYYVNRIRYAFGVTDNAQQTVELGGGSFYYGPGTPLEEEKTGNGATTAFATSETAIPHRIGGELGTTFKSVFSVIVDGVLLTEGVDYTQSPSNTATPGTATVTFTEAPASGAVILLTYFSSAEHSYPQGVHASTVTKPAAVRGRNICVYLGSGGTRQKVGSVQACELEFTIDGEVEREFCNTEIVGRTINGTDCTGSLTVRSRDADAFLTLLARFTGIAKTEVIGWLNQKQYPLEIAIQNPKNPAEILKTLYVSDAIFQTPGTPARVNTPTDFVIGWESSSGTYTVYNGAKP